MCTSYIVLTFEPHEYNSSLKISKQNYYGIKQAHSLYENNTTIRDMVINVRKHLTTGLVGEKLPANIPAFSMALPSLNLTQESQVYETYLHSFQEPFLCELPVSEPMTHGLLSAPASTGIQMAPGRNRNKQQCVRLRRTDFLLSFLTYAETRDSKNDLGQDW